MLSQREIMSEKYLMTSYVHLLNCTKRCLTDIIIERCQKISDIRYRKDVFWNSVGHFENDLLYKINSYGYSLDILFLSGISLIFSLSVQVNIFYQWFIHFFIVLYISIFCKSSTNSLLAVFMEIYLSLYFE